MYKKTLLLLLIGFFLNLSFFNSTVFGQTKEEKHTAKVKAAIAKLGIGNDSNVKVKLQDKTKINGYITKIAEDSFTVVDVEANLVTKIPYSQVKQVKGNNLSTGVRVAIGVGVILAIGIFYALLHPGD